MTQQSTDVTLEPCPFCGGEAEWSKGKHGDGSDWDYISCSDCECLGPPANSIKETEREHLIIGWNTRATLFKPVGGVMSAELRECVENMNEAMAELWEKIPPTISHKITNCFHKMARIARDAQLAQPPEGYCLVPIEPTEAMCFIALKELIEESKSAKVNTGQQSSRLFKELKMSWKAMIAAAPEAKGGKDV